ncbi:molecular chaperone TorD family protein, partial [Gordonibacter sp.]
RDIQRSLSKRNTGTRQELAVDFTGAFAGTSSWEGRCAMPCESVFTSEEGLMYQESYHEVHRLFKEHRVSRSAGFDFPDDHLSFMCTFMAMLSQRTAAALREGAYREALEQMRTSRTFLESHILSWFDRFEEL